MKKLLTVILLAALFLSACSNIKSESETSEAKSDWRNTVEYEGSFYVSKERKLLYSLDKGTVTLWDNKGSGSVFQTVDYETSVQNATDRFEKEDFNGDGYTDIRIIFSEEGSLCTYNLWLWSEKDIKFVECRDYRFIINPESSNGKVLSEITKEAFGTVACSYSFNDDFSMQLESFTCDTANNTAAKIAESLLGGTAALCEGNVTVSENICPVFSVSKDGKEIGYIAYSKDNQWFVDAGNLGCYREVTFENESYSLGDYTDEAKSVCDTLKKLQKATGAEITAADKGTMNSKSAVKYTVFVDGSAVFVVSDKDGMWYYSTDGTNYQKLRYSDATLGEAVGFTFE